MSLRDEIAEILEQIAEEGMPHPRHLDAALDAIECTIKEVYPDFTLEPEEDQDIDEEVR